MPIRKRNYGWLDKIEDPKQLYATIRELGKTDLYFLCKYILGMRDLETQTSIHYGECEFLENSENDRKLVVMFRDSFKTSIGLGNVVRWLLNNPDEQVGVGSDVEERAAERVDKVRNTFAHCEPLKYFYPDVCYKEPQGESDLWTKHAFNVRRTPYTAGFRMASVSSFGLFPLPVGSHYTKVFMDDLEHEANINTEELVEQLNERLSAFMPVLPKGAEYVQVGTIYHPEGPNTKRQGIWPTYKVPIYDKHGVPTFPSRFDLKGIEKKKNDVNNDYIWHGQYLLQSHPRTAKFFYPFRGITLQKFTLR